MIARIFIVALRRPRAKGDGRADPFWEFGSFGCTGCHAKNLLHPKNCPITNGDRLAFVQGGHLGSRLVLVTPPVRKTVFESAPGKPRVELRWDRKVRPFRYDCAPAVFDVPRPGGAQPFPLLAASLAGTNRATIDAKFASRFRARTNPLDAAIATEIVVGFERALASAAPAALAKHYTEALPRIDPAAVIQDRKAAYRERRRPDGKPARSCCSNPTAR